MIAKGLDNVIGEGFDAIACDVIDAPYSKETASVGHPWTFLKGPGSDTSKADIDIGPVAQSEIALLERHMTFGPPGKHYQRLVMQQKGEVVYLIAWYGALPVGHALLQWDGATDEPMASRLHDCPYIEDLFVSPNYRSRGIGSKLLAVGERLVMARGYCRSGLGVGIENPRARLLYESRGYTDSGMGEYPHIVSYVDRQGWERRRKETCVYLIKELH